MRFILYGLAVLLFFVSCKSARKNQVAPDVSMETPVGFYSDTLSTGKVDDGWLKTFNDPYLEKIVDEALKNNPSLSAAAANVDAVAGLVTIAGSKMKPSIVFGSPATVEGSSLSDDVTSGVGGGLALSWEADIWGKLAAGQAAATNDAIAAAANFEYGRQSLVAQTAKAYYVSIETWLQLVLADSVVTMYELNKKLVNAQFEQGRSNKQDLALINADLATAQDAYEATQAAHADAKRALELLLGRYPAAQIELPEILASIPPYPNAGLPSELLERRPDVVAAERQVGAAFERVNEAKAAQLPSLALDASLGGSLNPASTLWSVGAGFLLPITQGGALRANVEIRTSEQEAAVANYRDIALRAFNEVESSINNEMAFEKREQYLTSVRDNSIEAYELAMDQYKVGAIDLLSVLLLQQRAVNSQKALVNIQSNRLVQRINTHLALGGSFETNESDGVD